MAIKIRNIFSILISAILYSFFNMREEAGEPAEASTGRLLVLSSDNLDDIREGNWVVSTDIAPTSEHSSFQKDYNFALLRVNSYENAKIAAKLGMRRADESVILKNNKIIQNSVERPLKETVSFREALDYLIFYRILYFKRIIDANKSFESSILQLIASSPQILSSIF